jgi:hypothetical protein
VFLLCLPEKYDVNEEIGKYFLMRRERKQQQKMLRKEEEEGQELKSNRSSEKRRISIYCEGLHTGSIRIKTNIRDDIDDQEYMVDRVLLEPKDQNE